MWTSDYRLIWTPLSPIILLNGTIKASKYHRKIVGVLYHSNGVPIIDYNQSLIKSL